MRGVASCAQQSAADGVKKSPSPTLCLLFLSHEIRSTLKFVILGEGEISCEERRGMMEMTEGEKEEKNVARGERGCD